MCNATMCVSASGGLNGMVTSYAQVAVDSFILLSPWIQKTVPHTHENLLLTDTSLMVCSHVPDPQLRI